MENDKIKAEEQPKNNPVGRPRKDIDLEILANLASIGCTQEEIGSVMGISARTLQRNFAEIIEQNKNKGRASLRKKMWQIALKGNPNMLVWLSKNELNMRDKVETQNIVEPLPLIIEADVSDG